MPNINVEQQVMQRIVRLERRRTRWWVGLFWVGLILVAAFIGLSVVSIGVVLHKRESLKVLSIFSENWDSIRDGWFDAVRSIWFDIPRRHSIPTISASVVVVVAVVFTRRYRAMIRRWQASITSYDRDHQPTNPK